MKKSAKHLEKKLISALTDICEHYKDEPKNQIAPGFSWLTHIGNNEAYDASLRIYCIFDTLEQLKQAQENGLTNQLSDDIHQAVKKLAIKKAKAKQYIFFDCEETCELSHNGNWQARFHEKKH